MKLRTFLLGCGLLATLTGALGCGGHARSGDPSVDLVEPETVRFEARRAGPPGYTLGTGDRFDVDFLFQKQLTTRVIVRPDGFVSLPILGEVRAAGRTPAQLDSLLTGAYATYYRDPEVTVNVIEFAPVTAYVLGEVRNQRAVELQPGMTVLQAVAIAGGPTPQSNLDSVVLLRRLDDGSAYAQRIDLDRFLSGRGGSWDLLLAPYDIIYVPKSFIAKVNQFVDQFFSKMIPVPTLYLRGWEVFNTDEVYDTFLNNTVDNTSRE